MRICADRKDRETDRKCDAEPAEREPSGPIPAVIHSYEASFSAMSVLSWRMRPTGLSVH